MNKNYVWGGLIIGIGLLLILNHYVLHWVSPREMVWLLGLGFVIFIVVLYYRSKEVEQKSNYLSTQEAKDAMIRWVEKSEWNEKVDHTNSKYQVRRIFEKDPTTGQRVPFVGMTLKLTQTTYDRRDYLRVIMNLEEEDVWLVEGGVGEEYLENPFLNYEPFGKKQPMLMGGKGKKGVVINHYANAPNTIQPEDDDRQSRDEEDEER